MKCDSIQQVAVLGLGAMGHGIVQLFATAGYPVNAFDEVTAARDSLHERIRANLKLFVQAGLVDADQVEPILARITVTESERAAVESVQFITEAVREDLGVKQELLKRLETETSPETIIASNSSTFPISQSGEGMKHPERAIVTHYFNPPHVIPALEVVPGPQTSEATTQTTLELMRSTGKEAILIKKEIPGFVVNRIQMALAREVWDLLDKGIASAEDIDAAVSATMGIRLAAIGPLQVNDLGGLEIVTHVYNNLVPELRSDAVIPPVVQNLVDGGHFGVKTGQGFYNYPADTIKATTAARDARLLDLLKLFYDWKKAKASQ